MKYNTQKDQLIIPEYGRHIHSMANGLKNIKDKKKRNQQAQVLINIMGNLNPHLRDNEEYNYKLWDHLFTICNNDIDINSPYEKPSPKEESKIIERIDNTQGSVKHKHYGRLIIDLIKETVKITDSKVKEYLIKLIALQMKRSYISWNQSNVQDIQIWSDLDFFSNHKLELNKDAVIPVYPTNNVVRKKTFHKKSIKKNYSRK
tara:strand:+ start:1417 stop:2025 length:609 start_codon:yes stop_codon:yes gene_type:complete